MFVSELLEDNYRINTINAHSDWRSKLVSRWPTHNFCMPLNFGYEKDWIICEKVSATLIQTVVMDWMLSTVSELQSAEKWEKNRNSIRFNTAVKLGLKDDIKNRTLSPELSVIYNDKVTKPHRGLCFKNGSRNDKGRSRYTSQSHRIWIRNLILNANNYSMWCSSPAIATELFHRRILPKLFDQT